MKNNSKEVGKKLYRVYYNGITKSFEIKEFDIQLVTDDGVYYLDQHGINTMYDSGYRVAEFTVFSITAENYAKDRLLDYLLGERSSDIAFIMSFIHKENAEEFIETHQDLLKKVKDLTPYYDKIEPQFKRGSISQQLTYLNEDIRSIMHSKKYYKTDSIKDFLYTYISDVIDNCEALATKEDFLYDYISNALDNCKAEPKEKKKESTS